MKCDVYQGKKKRNKQVIVEAGKGTDREPKEIVEQLGELKQIKQIDVEENKPLIGLDPKAALEAIKKNGYHIAQVAAVVTEKAGH